MGANNYIRFMDGPRTTHVVCFDSKDPASVEKAQEAIQQRGRKRAVIWHAVSPFADLPEVGRMKLGVLEGSSDAR